ncbi:DUF6311 domain-containing protein [Polynucleobacter sp. IMCC 29146]|uniref:DUF6311 domain-containing protein n=1 Tax=Polynucleobacter sp. IMCC 29146 TaxID=2780953 RepID=UPI001F2A91A8|nr:DUF6311 domain-containing protein [Polynucleobacter sp. IMCC 29146]MCE7530523.1 DUF6311 domain-containing protein [Polynucleobacter sp. IMCC 29146]
MPKFLKIFCSKSPLLIPVVLGIGSFLLVAGPFVALPWNEQWLFGGGDATQHYFGWLFYRASPWTFPIGMNPDYGISINNSIVYTDSIPLLAIFFKAINFLLPKTFQYFGLYIFTCFLLQAISAWFLLGLFIKNIGIRFFATGLFIFSVPMISLFPENPQLASQFLILFSLYLNLNKKEGSSLLAWLTLLCCAVLINFYYFVMVFVLWIAYLLDKVFIRKIISMQIMLCNFIFLMTVILLSAWQAGYFAISSIGEFGFGLFKTNVLGIFNPDGWSYLFKALYPKVSWWAEEPVYLGIGCLIALLFSLKSGRQFLSPVYRQFKSHFFLMLIIICMALFSFSHNISIGSFELQLPLHKKVADLVSILRNSGRMFIPFFYCILLLIFYQIEKSYSGKIAAFILGFCLTIQIIDLNFGWQDLRNRMTSMGPFPYSELPLKNNFWNMVPANYKNIIVVPSRFNLKPDFMARFLNSEWRIFGRYASINKMATNAVYVARSDKALMLQSRENALNEISTGIFNNNSLYIINSDEILSAACAGMEYPQTLFAKIDGFYILAPNFLKSSGEALNSGIQRITLSQPAAKLGESFFFSKSDSKNLPFVVCGGWSNPEAWGIWSDGNSSKLFLPLPEGANRLELILNAFISSAHPKQKVQVMANGKNLLDVELKQNSDNKVELNIPQFAKEAGHLLLSFTFSNPISPKALGISEDNRSLAIGIVSGKYTQ